MQQEGSLLGGQATLPDRGKHDNTTLLFMSQGDRLPGHASRVTESLNS